LREGQLYSRGDDDVFVSENTAAGRNATPVGGASRPSVIGTGLNLFGCRASQRSTPGE